MRERARARERERERTGERARERARAREREREARTGLWVYLPCVCVCIKACRVCVFAERYIEYTYFIHPCTCILHTQRERERERENGIERGTKSERAREGDSDQIPKRVLLADYKCVPQTTEYRTRQKRSCSPVWGGSCPPVCACVFVCVKRSCVCLCVSREVACVCVCEEKWQSSLGRP